MTQRAYTEGLLGKKLGMTQIFTPEGEAVGVTVIQVGPCTVLDIRNTNNNGYNSVQFGFEPKKAQRVDKASTGHFAKAGKGAFYHVKEIRYSEEAPKYELGQEVKASDLFNAGDIIDVSGVSIGRGFSGVVRRFKVKGQPATRGTHEYRRHIGSIGCRKFPGRVFKNKKMPGRMGTDTITVQNLKVVAVKAEDNIILVRGGIPGFSGGLVTVKKTKRNKAA